jgi:type IV fimbrial biogenesis protein FimT
MKCRSGGVTLIELMTALGVLAILVAIAVPSFRGYTLRSRVTAAANDLVTAFNLARSEALRGSLNAVACASSNPDATTPACSGSTDWSNGWIVFADTNRNGDVNVGERVVQSWPALHAQIVLEGDTRATWNTMGMATGDADYEVSIGACQVERQIDVAVSLSGAIRSSRVTCGGS